MHAILWSLGFVALIPLAFLLSHGTAGGDEGGVLQFLATYRRGGWAELAATSTDHDFLAHRLFWLGEKLLWESIIRVLVPISLFSHPAIYSALMVVDDTIFMMAAFALAVWHLQKRHTSSVALLATSALFIASSGIGLFAGGFSECLMVLMVIAMMSQLDQPQSLTISGFVLLVLAGLGLIASKLYAAPFVLALTLLIPSSRRVKIVYASIMIAAPFIWLAIQSGVRGPEPSGMMNFYIGLMEGRGIIGFLSDCFAFFFSLSFGISPCFPLLSIIFLCDKTHNFALTIKVAAVIGVSAILLFFPFWAGPGGLGGPRYIVPFLMVFLPEIAAGLRRLVENRRHGWLLLVPITAILFLPSLEFRNSLAPRYLNDSRSVVDTTWSHMDMGMHPAIMAWSVAIAKAQGQQTISLSAMTPANAQDVFPMTTLSRIIYVLEFDRPPPQVQAVKDMLKRYGMDVVELWGTLRWLLVLGLLSWLTIAAWPRHELR
jgi:hypothetical protein